MSSRPTPRITRSSSLAAAESPDAGSQTSSTPSMRGLRSSMQALPVGDGENPGDMAVDDADAGDADDNAGVLNEDRVPTPTAPPTSALALAPIPTGALRDKAPYHVNNFRDKVFCRFGDRDYDEDMFFDAGLLRHAADCVADWNFSIKSDPWNYALGRYALAEEKEEWALTKQINNWFGGEVEPHVQDARCNGFVGRLWWADAEVRAKKKADTLIPRDHTAVELRHRDDSSFLWTSSLHLCWPLPLTCGPTASFDVVWSFSFKAIGKDLEGLLVLSETMSSLFVGTAFAAYVVSALHTLPTDSTVQTRREGLGDTT